MTTEPNKQNKRGNIALRLLTAAIILFVGIYALRGVLIAPYIISFLEETIESDLGLKISISEIGGSYFSDLELKNVKTVKHLPDSPLTQLQLDQLKLTYRLRDLLGGLPSFLAGSAIVLDGAQLSIDLTVKRESEDVADASPGHRLPPVLPRMDIRNSSVRIQGNGYETRFDGLVLTARSVRPGESRFRLHVAQWSLQHPALRKNSVVLEADIAYADQKLRIEKLWVDRQVIVKSAKIDLGEMAHPIPFELSLNLTGGQFHASGRVAPDRLEVELSGSDIDLSRISELLASEIVPFGGRLSMRGQLNLLPSEPQGIIGDLKIQVLNGSVQDTYFQQLVFRFLADDRNLRVEDLLLTNSADRLSISRASVPAAVFYGAGLNDIWRSLAVHWQLEGTDIPALLKIAGLEFQKPDGPIPSHRLMINGRMEDGRLIIPHGRLDLEDGYILLNAADIALPIGGRVLKNSPLTGELSVDLPDAEHLSRIFSLPALGGSVQAKIKASGTLLAPQGEAHISGRALTYRSLPLGNFSVRAKADTRSLTIESAVLEKGNDRAIGHGTLILAEKSFENVNVELSVVDLAPYFSEPPLQPGPSPQSDPNVGGGLKATLRLDGPFSGPTGSLSLQARDMRIESTPIGNADIALMFSADRIEVSSAELTMDQQQLQLAADIERKADDSEFKITLKKVSVIGRRMLLALEREANCRLFRSGRIIFDNVALAGSAGRVSIDGVFDPNESSDLRIALKGLDGDGWFDRIFTERIRFQGLDASLRASGQTNAPAIAVQGTVDHFGSPDIPMAFSGRFKVEYGNRVLKIDEFSWQGTTGQQVELSGSFPLDPWHSDMFPSGPLALNGRAHLDDAGVLAFIIPWVKDSDGAIQCDFNLSGTWKHPSGKIHLAVDNLQRPAGIRPLPPGPYTGNGDVRIDGDLVTLESLEAYSSAWKVQIQGQWRGAPKLADLIGSEESQVTGRVDLAGSLNVSDLSWVERELDGVRRLTGRLEVQGALQGPITAPAADAVIRLSDAEFAPDFDMPSLRSLNLDAAVTPEAVKIHSLTGELGGAPFQLAGFWPLSEGSGPGTDLRLRGKNLLLYRSESTRLRADTDLTLKGPLARLELAGEVAITDGRFSQNFGVLEGFAAAGQSDGGKGFQLFSIRKPPWRDMVFNVSITDRKAFIIRNNLVRGSVRPDLVLKGTGELPVLLGNVYVGSTRLYLPAGRMQLETGLVRFDRVDPDRPRLDLIGTSTMLGYDITAVIEGPYDEPVITLSSTPPLPNEDLLMLLLTGQPPKSSTTRSDTARQSLNVAVFLGRDLLARLSDDDSAEAFESILDRFDVEVGRGITQRGEDTIHSQFRIADGILVEGDSLYLTGERDYFDYYNGGIKLVFRFR